jgi:hypothetical protein
MPTCTVIIVVSDLQTEAPAGMMLESPLTSLASPAANMSESLTSLSGKWKMNRDSSSDVSDVLEIQGFNAITRKIAAAAPVSLDITQKGKDEIRIKQNTAASIPGIQEGMHFLPAYRV